MSAVRTRRLLASASLIALLCAYLAPWPASAILFGLGLLIAIALLVRRPTQADLAARASETCESPDLMTIWEVAEASGADVNAVLLALERDGVPRADRLGWRARLPVPMTQIRYRRTDVARWLSAQEGH